MTTPHNQVNPDLTEQPCTCNSEIDHGRPTADPIDTLRGFVDRAAAFQRYADQNGFGRPQDGPA